MKTKIFLMCLLTLLGSNAGVASVVLGNDDSRTAAMTSVGANAETIALKSDVSASAFSELLADNTEEHHMGSLVTNKLIQAPIPPTAWLLSSILVGLTVVARRKSAA